MKKKISMIALLMAMLLAVGGFTTSTAVSLFPNWISILSPGFTFVPAFAALPFTRTLPALQASFATVLLLISLDTFKNLSKRMIMSPSFFYVILLK